MKLSREQIEAISALIIANLKKKDLVTFKAPEASVLKRIVDIFTDDLKKEDDLDREVEAMLARHAPAMGAERIDYRKMFNMIKNKLARERGVVL